MKPHLAILCILLISASGCIKDKIIETSNLETSGDLYTGTILYSTEYMDENMSVLFNVVYEMDYSFRKHEGRYFAYPSEKGVCNDLISIKADSMNFTSNNSCACWCDCDPRVDCSGFLLFGEWKFNEAGDTLFLERNPGIREHPYPEFSAQNHHFYRPITKGVFVKTIE